MAPCIHQTAGLPEALSQGREDLYLGWFYQNFGATPEVFSQEEIDDYVRSYRAPGALAAGSEYYRMLQQDIQDNARRLASSRVTMPVLAIGGDSGWGRRGEVLESLSRVAIVVRGGVVENCGHWMPDEQPEAVADQLLRFFE